MFMKVIHEGWITRNKEVMMGEALYQGNEDYGGVDIKENQ
jgi:hypothetical protein